MNTTTTTDLVSTKFVSSRNYSLRLEHHCWNCDSHNERGRRDCHEYVYPVSAEVGLLRYEGVVRVYIKELSRNIYIDDTVNVVFDIECFRGEEREWSFFYKFATEHLQGFRNEDAEDENFGYFILGRIAHELRRVFAMEIYPGRAEAALKEYAKKKEAEFNALILNYLDMKHWMSDINVDAKDKLWRANSEFHFNRDGKFITYTKIEGNLQRDDFYFMDSCPEVKERYPKEDEI